LDEKQPQEKITSDYLSGQGNNKLKDNETREEENVGRGALTWE
jgi:hypothetical protein